MSAAWRHDGARAGFEVVFGATTADGCRFEGHCTAVAEGQPWSVGYVITVDPAWVTRSAEIRELSQGGRTARLLEHDGDGQWLVDGAAAPALEGCLDADLEASAFTNALPVRRLRLGVGESGRSPAAWVRSPGLGVERLEQGYARLPDARASAASAMRHRSSASGPSCATTKPEWGWTIRAWPSGFSSEPPVRERAAKSEIRALPLSDGARARRAGTPILSGAWPRTPKS